MTLTEVKVMNTDLKTPYLMYVRADRLQAFLESLNCRCFVWERDDWQMGVDGAAVVGMNAIFTQIPNKFPMVDILRFLNEKFQEMLGHPTTLSKIERHLADFGRQFPGITGSGEDVE